MPQQKFHLDTAKTQQLLVKWKGSWKEVTVFHNGQQLGEPFPNLAALKTGNDFALPDGRTLHVRFQSGFAKSGLELTINGRPIPGSGSDPKVELKATAGAIWFIAGLSALLGALGMSGVRFLEDMGFGWPSLVAGLAFGALAWLVGQKRSTVALAIAVGLFAVDTVVTLMVGMDAGGRVPTTGLIIRAFLFIFMIRGFGAIKRANAADQEAAVAAQF